MYLDAYELWSFAILSGDMASNVWNILMTQWISEIYTENAIVCTPQVFSCFIQYMYCLWYDMHIVIIVAITQYLQQCYWAKQTLKKTYVTYAASRNKKYALVHKIPTYRGKMNYQNAKAKSTFLPLHLRIRHSEYIIFICNDNFNYHIRTKRATC